MTNINNGPILIVSSDDRTYIEKNIDSRYRHVHNKQSEQIAPLPDFYSDKTKALEEFIKEEQLKSAELLKVLSKDISTLELLPDIIQTRGTIARYGRKQLAILGELDGRDKGIFLTTLLDTDPFFRDLHWTEYFIDLNAGNDGNTGLNIGQAWLTFGQYLVTTVRTPGDIGYVRAGTTQIMSANQLTDEDGDQDDYIYLIGCDSVINDPWSDGSDVNPIADFGATAFYWYALYLRYWHYKNLDFKGGISALGNFYSPTSADDILEKCRFYDYSNAGRAPLYLNVTSNIKGIDCDFFNNSKWNLYEVATANEFINCTFEGGGASAKGTFHRSSVSVFNKCSWGQAVPFANNWDIEFYYSPNILYLENCLYNGIYFKHEGSATSIPVSEAFSSDDQQVKGAHKSYRSWTGTVEKKTASLFSGGADSYAEMIPKQYIGENKPFKLSGNQPNDRAFRVLCSAEEVTVTVKMRASASGGAWSVPPINTELYLVVSYLDHAVNATRSEIQSTQVISGTAVTEFSVTFEPLQRGFADLDVVLIKYESGKGIDVDIKPIPDNDEREIYEWQGGKIVSLLPQVVPVAPTISDFSVDQATIDEGDSATLSWTIFGAATASINEGIGSVSASSGTKNISPTDTTTYILTATHADGTISFSSVKVTVNQRTVDGTISLAVDEDEVILEVE